MRKIKLPNGWSEKKVRKVLDHYEHQSGADAVAEDELSYKKRTRTVMQVPIKLVPAVRELIANQSRRAG